MDNLYLLDLNVTGDCNWRCKYCIEKNHHCNNYMSEDVADKIIEKIDFLLDNNYYDNIQFGFWGGEPTLNYPIIEKFVDYYYKNIKVRFNIFTNGSLLEKYYPLIDKCVNYFNNPSRFETQISYDGYPIHERKRRTVDNLPTADSTRQLIKEVYNKGYNFNLKSTFSYDDVDYIYDSYLDILDLYTELNDYHGILYSPTIDYSHEFIISMDCINDNLDNFKNKIINQIEKICLNEYNRIDNTGKYPLFTWMSEENANKFCGAGNNYHTVNYNGDLYTCHGCLYINNYKDHIFASVYDDNNIFYNKITNHSKLFENMNSNIPEKCRNCTSIVCYKCNAECYNNSNKTTFSDKWYDFSYNEKYLCLLYKEISYLILAWKDILMNKLKMVVI
jgi:sulfatase maturation enzyme AslB (radical SAM superfamily)